MKLKEWLQREGMLGRAFAEKVNASPSTISLIISGKRSPSVELAARIERVTKGKVRATDLARDASQSFRQVAAE